MNHSITDGGGSPHAPPYAPIARWVLPLALAILVLVALVYIPAYHAGFIWDDDDYILLNPMVRQAGGMGEIWNPASSLNPQWYPFVFTTFRLEYILWGLNPLGYHIVNVLLHALSAVLLLVLLQRIGVPGAWLVAALFAVHPVFVESVAWITERKNVLCVFFFLLAALCYVQFDRGSRYRWFGLSLICFLLALGSKSVAAVLPVGLGLMLWWRRRLGSPSRVLTLLAMLGIGFTVGMVTRMHEYRHMLAGEGEGSVFGDLDFAERVLIAGRSFWFYPFKLIWPADLSFIYTRWEVSPGAWQQWLFPLAVPALALFLLVMLWRGRIGRGPVAAAAFYAAAIFPALGFVNIVFTRYSFVADHFQYLAAIGVLLLFGGIWSKMAGTKSSGPTRSPRALALTLPALIVLGLLAWVSVRQAGTYQDLGTLWSHTVEKSPRNWMVQVNYGVWLKQQGDLAGAAACYERAISLSPPPSEAAIVASANLASVRYCQHRYDLALKAAESCLSYRPDHPLALYNRGRALWGLGRLQEAEQCLEHLLALSYDPDQGRTAWDIRRRLDDARVNFVLAQTQIGQSKIDQALASYDRALALSPAEEQLHKSKLQILFQSGRLGEAIAASRRAIQVVADTKPFRMQLALLLAVAPEAGDRDGEEALQITEGLIAEGGDRNPHLLSLRAAALAELGRYEEALATARRALAIADETGDRGIANQLRAQAASFEKGEPLRHSSSAAAKLR